MLEVPGLECTADAPRAPARERFHTPCQGVKTRPPDGSSGCPANLLGTMSKKTNKRKIKARRKKANHGKKPNAGR